MTAGMMGDLVNEALEMWICEREKSCAADRLDKMAIR